MDGDCCSVIMIYRVIIGWMSIEDSKKNLENNRYKMNKDKQRDEQYYDTSDDKKKKKCMTKTNNMYHTW